MKFTNIPENGASWSGELLYSFNTGEAEVRDVSLVVRNADSGEELGRMRLYGITEATVDIAPIVRRRMSESLCPVEATTLTIVESPSVCRVVVECDGIQSAVRTLFRSEFSTTAAQMLSSPIELDGIAPGECIRLTLTPLKGLTVNIGLWGSGELLHQDRRSVATAVAPYEVVIPVGELDYTVDTIIVGVVSGTQSEELIFSVTGRPEASRRLVWYNTKGGIESYTFPLSQRLKRVVHEVTTTYNEGSECYIKSAESVVRLTSSRLTQAEMEHLIEIIRSPRIFEECAEGLRPVRLEAREVHYDSHGALPRLSLNIIEEWKGGER